MANVNVEAFQSNINVTSTSTTFTVSEGNSVVANVISTSSNVGVTTDNVIVAVAQTADIANSEILSLFSVENVSGYGNLAYDSTVLSNGVIQYTGVSNSDIRGRFSAVDSGGYGTIVYDQANGIFTYSGVTPAEIRAQMASIQTGGDGSFTYNTGSGIMTYTGPDQTEANARIANASLQVRSHFSATTGVANYNSTTGVITIPGTTDHITEGSNLWLNGSGTTDDLTEGSTNEYYTNARVKAYLITTTRDEELDIDTRANATYPDKGSVRTGSIFAETLINSDGPITTNGSTLNTDNMSITDSRGLFVNTDGETYNGDSNKIPVVEVNQPTSSANADVTIKYKWDTDQWLVTDGTGTEYAFLVRTTDDLPEGSANLYLNGSGTTDDLAEGSANLWYTVGRANSAIDARVDKAFVDALNVDADTLDGNDSTYYLNYLNLYNEPTDLSAFTNSPGYITQSSGDTRYVNVSGDTMTGNLEISRANPKFSITQTGLAASTGQVDFLSKSATLNIQVPDTGASGGSPPEYNPMMTNATGIWFNRDATNSDTGLETPITLHASGAYPQGNTIFWYESTQSTGYQGWHFENDDNVLRPFYQTAQANADIVAYFGDAANGPFTINGNLDVQGNLNYVNVEDLLVNDQSITLNYGNATARDAFIYVDRSGTGGGTNVALKWNETTNTWQFTNDGSTYYNIPASTSDLAEGTNLYYTDSRFDTRFATKTTDNLTEGTTNLYFANSLVDNWLTSKTTDDLTQGSTNLYFTYDNANTWLATKTTDNLTEGSNLYYTTARANSAIDAYVTGGNAISVASGVVSLDNTAVTPGTYGDGGNVAQITVDQQGRLTSVTEVAITGAGGYGNADVQNFLENGYSAANINANDIVAVTFTGDGSDLTSVRAETIEVTIKNADTVQIDKGMPVHAIGTAVGGEVEVVLADAGNAQLMPAHFIANETLASTGDSGRGILSGRIFGVDTSSFTVGDTIFVAVGGGYANVAPSGEANLIQNLGVVTEVAVSGQGEVYGAGRAAATPNLDDGALFVGSSANKAIAVDTSTNFNVSDTTFELSNAITNVNSITAETGGANIELSTDYTEFKLAYGDYFGNPALPRGYASVGTVSGKAPYLNVFQTYIEDSIAVGGAVAAGSAIHLGGSYLYLGCDQHTDFNTYTGTTTPGNVALQFGVGNVNIDGTNYNTYASIRASNRDRNGNVTYDMKLGWADPIPAEAPHFDSGATTFKAFEDLAYKYEDNTFNGNVTVTGDTTVNGKLTTSSSNVTLTQFQETVVALGNQSGDISTVADFNAANASIFTLTATGGITISSIPNAQAGSSYTIKITQDGTGSHALTSTFKYVGGDKTLSTDPGSIDVISVLYDGTDYLASLTKDYS